MVQDAVHEQVHVMVSELLLGGILNALREEHECWVRLRVATLIQLWRLTALALPCELLA